MAEESERNVLLRGMGEGAGGGQPDMEVPVSAKDVAACGEDRGETADGSPRDEIPHRETTGDEEEAGAGLIPREPVYKDIPGRQGLIAVILSVIGIPAMIFLASNIAVSAGLIPSLAKNIVTGVLFIAAAIVLLTEKSD